MFADRIALGGDSRATNQGIESTFCGSMTPGDDNEVVSTG